MHSDFIVFADESGDHSLTKINPVYPVFVLSFCIFSKTDYVETVCPLFQRFKMRWWLHDGVVLHSLRIRQRQAPILVLEDTGQARAVHEFSIEFFDKKSNLLGLQVADLVSTPIGQHVLRPERQNRAFEVIQQKFDGAPNGEPMGWGLQVFPQKTKGLD